MYKNLVNTNRKWKIFRQCEDSKWRNSKRKMDSFCPSKLLQMYRPIKFLIDLSDEKNARNPDFSGNFMLLLCFSWETSMFNTLSSAIEANFVFSHLFPPQVFNLKKYQMNFFCFCCGNQKVISVMQIRDRFKRTTKKSYFSLCNCCFCRLVD